MRQLLLLVACPVAPAVVVPETSPPTQPGNVEPTRSATPTTPEAKAADPKAEQEAELYVAQAGGVVIREVSHVTRGQPVFAVLFDGKDCGRLELKRLAVFPQLHRLTFSGTTNTDAVVKQLPDLPNVTMLSLEGSDVTDAGLAAVAAMPRLKDLDLTRAGRLTPAGFQALGGSKTLEVLNATETAIDDPAVRTLGGVTTLTALVLKGTKVTLADTGAAFSGWAKLARLDLTGTGVGDAALIPVGVARALEELHLNGAAVTDGGLKPLAKLSRLKTLHLGGCARVTGEGLNHLAGLRNLEALYLSDTGLTDAGMTAVAKLKSVKTLELDRTRVTDAGLRELANPRGLEVLSIEETNAGDAALIELAEAVRPLARVSARKSKVTEQGARAARAKSDNLSVHLD